LARGQANARPLSDVSLLGLSIHTGGAGVANRESREGGASWQAFSAGQAVGFWWQTTVIEVRRRTVPQWPKLMVIEHAEAIWLAKCKCSLRGRVGRGGTRVHLPAPLMKNRCLLRHKRGCGGMYETERLGFEIARETCNSARAPVSLLNGARQSKRAVRQGY